MPLRGCILAVLVPIVSICIGCGQEGDGGEPSALVSGLLSVTSDEQAEVIADGTVTASEYEASVYATIACLEEQGGEVFDIRNDGVAITFQYRGSEGSPDSQPEVLSYQECYRTWQREVDILWSDHNRPSEMEIAEAREAFAACFLDRGVELAETTQAALIEASQSYPREFGACAQRVQDEYGFVP